MSKATDRVIRILSRQHETLLDERNALRAEVAELRRTVAVHDLCRTRANSFANGKVYRVASRCRDGSLEQRDVKVDEIWLALDMSVTLLRGFEFLMRDAWQKEEMRKILDVAWGPNR